MMARNASKPAAWMIACVAIGAAQRASAKAHVQTIAAAASPAVITRAADHAGLYEDRCCSAASALAASICAEAIGTNPSKPIRPLAQANRRADNRARVANYTVRAKRATQSRGVKASCSAGPGAVTVSPESVNAA
jgi:hypothetical protein